MDSKENNSEPEAECTVCPHHCTIDEGKTGICGVRKNIRGKIELITYGIISGLAIDPVEKKPLYHFFPGHNILSAGSWGCNMRCDFCQNWHISQNVTADSTGIISPEDMLKKIRTANNNIGIAFTYNEPVIWYEYVRDASYAAKRAGFYTVMVTNGFVSGEYLRRYLELIDAFNVDLKSFSDDFYRKLTGSRLEPVKKALGIIASSGRHLEITTLVIPGRNDDPAMIEEQVKWIAGELGKDIPFHLSRYFPMFRRSDPATPPDILRSFHEIASKHLSYVYLGNTSSAAGQDTYCPGCGLKITARTGYHSEHLNTADGNCSGCGREIYRYFTFSSSSSKSC